MNIKSMTIWLLGPTSSGKTTIANNVFKNLNKKKFPIMHFDGDEIRNFFGKDFGFNETNRMKVIETLVHLSLKSNNSGIPAIVSALTAHETARNYIKTKIPNLLTIYVKCPISVCAERDPKGLYKQASSGKINTLIGYNSKYIPPKKPDFIINTNKKNIKQCTNELLQFLSL